MMERVPFERPELAKTRHPMRNVLGWIKMVFGRVEWMRQMNWQCGIIWVGDVMRAW